MYPFKGFNILEYIEANSEALSVPKAKIDSLKKLLDALWGEYRTYSSKGINVPNTLKGICILLYWIQKFLMWSLTRYGYLLLMK